MSDTTSRSVQPQGVTRRSLLAGAAAAVALPSVIPASALGKDGAKAPSERIAMGFIGVGGRGSGHVGSFSGMKDTQVLAVCDPQKAKITANKARVDKRYGNTDCAAYQDFRKVLAREDIDAVVIASPENWHALHSSLAVRAGKDVYCEKALSLTVAEGRALCKAVRRYGRILQVGTQQRSDARFRQACELALNGYLGKLKTVYVGVPGGRSLPVAPAKPAPANIDYDLWLGPAPWTPYNDLKCSFNWYFISDYCAGWIQSWGVHHCDIALWGAPRFCTGRVTVEGTATFPTEGIADTSITWNTKITAADGTVFSFCNNTQPGHPQGVKFEGDKGWVHVRRGGIKASDTELLRTVMKADDKRLYVSSNHARNFLECIRTRREPAAPVEAGHRATTISLVADIATRLRRKVTFDWKTETFIKDAAADRMLSRSFRAPWRM